ncbi:hypothetical protein COLO4_20851 [Corchorus olitorius]|uniref:F-box/LRR-repeat protein 15/At3g58940/PEG3-like LRR domain-containing protein n=1 Tax=Corchorus olitorius TaxID=93759 RepID=A0A1R3IWI3_9ROSI|nr:hypothetical protein COLO4_20851 [Corchorus olitorius]
MKAYIIIHRGEEVPQMKSYEYYNTQLEEEEEDPKMISFENFITQVLSRRYHTDLVKVWFFTQKYYLGYKIWKLYSSALEWLISYAVDRNVQQLNIQSEFYNGFELSENFYICQSLETFNVHASSNILPKFMSLPALKSLHLWGLEITTNWFNPMNLSGCPNLESLKLIDIHCGQEPKKTLDLSCTWYKPRGESLEVFDLRDKTLFVNAPNLKRLELSFRRSSKEDGCKVVIGAPGLMTFQYRGFYPIVCSSVDLVSIDDVCFDIYNGYKINPMIVEKALDVNHERVLGLINTFKAFRHAKSITLPLETVQISLSLKALARFPSLRVENQFTYSNLKYLKIELQRSCNGIEIPGCVLNIFLNSYTKLRFCQHR